MFNRPSSHLPSRMPPISAPPRGSEKNASTTPRRISSIARAEYSMTKGHSGVLHVVVSVMDLVWHSVPALDAGFYRGALVFQNYLGHGHFGRVRHRQRH